MPRAAAACRHPATPSRTRPALSGAGKESDSTGSASSERPLHLRLAYCRAQVEEVLLGCCTCPPGRALCWWPCRQSWQGHAAALGWPGACMARRCHPQLLCPDRQSAEALGRHGVDGGGRSSADEPPPRSWHQLAAAAARAATVRAAGTHLCSGAAQSRSARALALRNEPPRLGRSDS